MIKKALLSTAITVVVGGFLSTPVLAAHCPNDAKKINAAMSKMDDKKMSMAKDAAAKGAEEIPPSAREVCEELEPVRRGENHGPRQRQRDRREDCRLCAMDARAEGYQTKQGIVLEAVQPRLGRERTRAGQVALAQRPEVRAGRVANRPESPAGACRRG